MIKISHGTRVGQIEPTNGYGYATVWITTSLRRLGYTFEPNDATAPVELWFDQPQHWTWRDKQFKIGYHPWESTEIDPDWLKAMGKCDEVWTPSPIVADWYRNWGLPEVYVYEHGVDTETWSHAERPVDDKIKFLHVGGEALRKGWDHRKGKIPNITSAFRAAFGNRDDVELTLKVNLPGVNVPELYSNIKMFNGIVSLDELVAMHHRHHIFVYPSWGEGFGLNPLQAMSTGMPVICTGAWAPYRRLLDPDLTVKSTLVDSPWPDIHPGKMFQPNFDDLVDKMRWAVDNYEDCVDDAHPRAQAVAEEYDWDTLTSKAFTALEWRLFSQGKIPNPPGL